MKYLLTALLAITFITAGCDKKTTDSNDDTNDLINYTSGNVKNITEYFNFATNFGSTDANLEHDLVLFTIKTRPAPSAPEISFPYFKAKQGISIAPLKNSILKKVNEVPATANFLLNYSTEGDDWFYMVNQTTVVPYENVYVINTADGKFPAFQITNYYAEEEQEDGTIKVVSGYYTIEWKYLSE